MAESEKDVTQCESIRAVATALQSCCLIKLIRSLPLRNFDLAFEAVSNGAFAEIVREWLETAEYVLYSSDSSPASCWIKLSYLPSLLWSPSSMEQRALHILRICCDLSHFQVVSGWVRWETSRNTLILRRGTVVMWLEWWNSISKLHVSIMIFALIENAI